MKKKSNLFAVILLGSLFLLSGCDQGQKKEATEANVKKTSTFSCILFGTT